MKSFLSPLPSSDLCSVPSVKVVSSSSAASAMYETERSKDLQNQKYEPQCLRSGAVDHQCSKVVAEQLKVY